VSPYLTGFPNKGSLTILTRKAMKHSDFGAQSAPQLIFSERNFEVEYRTSDRLKENPYI